MTDARPDTVLHEVVGPVGRLTLNRPRTINSLNDEMVTEMLRVLDEWADDPAVRAVWLEGAGDKGLCAGGDVVGLRASVLAGDEESVLGFWEREYALNARIASYPKPYVVWMDGVVMGGGVGVSAHGSHRIVTQRTKLAMPETIIGFFPDVGGLWFLSRAPGELGTHVALTGLPVNGADAVLLGVADALVPSSAKDAVLADLASGLSGESLDPKPMGWPIPSADVLAVEGVELPEPSLAQHREWIDECYAGDDPVAIVDRLTRHTHPAAREAAATIEQRSPHSVTVTLAALRRAASLSVEEVLAQDRRLGRAFAGHPDFAEGIRALLVDKDRSPRWADRHVRDVDRHTVLAAV